VCAKFEKIDKLKKSQCIENKESRKESSFSSEGFTERSTQAFHQRE
jgi:hypothetical protein